MEPTSPFSPSSPLPGVLPTSAAAAQGESAFPLDDAPSALQHSHSNSKVPRSVKFDPSVKDGSTNPDDTRNSNSHTSNAAAGRAADGMEDALSPFNSRPHPQVELPPFQLTRDDVEAAFEFLDVSGTGILTMTNLKQRLSAFYPQLTSKEYKFLVEDPSGTNTTPGGAHGGGSGNNHSRSANAAAATAASGHDALRADGSPSHGDGPISDSFGMSGTGRNHAEGLTSPDSGAATPASGRTFGSRAGLDVDQLWELIQSFQQLQNTLGMSSSAADATAYRLSTSGTSRRHNNNASSLPAPAMYDVGLAAGLVGSTAMALDSEGGFDAVGEAFRVYDPRNTHFVEEEVLSRIMAQIGFGELSDEELAVLVSTADFDGDGRISLDDFRHLVSMKGRLNEKD